MEKHVAAAWLPLRLPIAQYPMATKQITGLCPHAVIGEVLPPPLVLYSAAGYSMNLCGIARVLAMVSERGY